MKLCKAKAILGVPVAAAALSLVSSAQGQILYDQSAPLITQPNGGCPTNPGVKHDSELQNQAGVCANTFGFNINGAGGFGAADDFTLAGPATVTGFRFYGYQTGSPGGPPPTSTMTGVMVEIYNGVPGAGGTVIAGSPTTNVMSSTSWSTIYRSTETGASIDNCTRPIMVIEATMGTPVNLAPGTYWVAWRLTGSLASGPWVPSLTVEGAPPPAGNARQLNGTAWAQLFDTGAGTACAGSPPPPGYPVDLPFVVLGSGADPCQQALPPCRTDVGGANNGPPDGVTNVSDLLIVINTWGQTQNPPGSGPRPKGDCHPLPNGDCVVNVSDLLAVISGWGNCPAATGQCCLGNSNCQIMTQASCASAGGTYGGDNTTCSPNPCPSNDGCAGSVPLTIGGPCVAGSLLDATSDATSCNVPGQGRWFSVIGNGTTLTASTCGSNTEQFYNSTLAVLCGPNCNELFCVASSDSNACSLFETVSWCSANGQKYWILVQTTDPAGEGQFCVNVTGGATCNNPIACTPPTAPNDECGQALTVTLGTNTVDNSLATNSAGVPDGNCGASQCSAMGRDVWYTFTPSSAGVYVFDMCPSTPTRDFMMQILGGTCGNLTHIAGDDDTCGGGGYPQVIATLTAAPVFVRIGNWCQTPACDPPSGVPGAATLLISQNQAVCGNGQIEPGEQCDDPTPGCVNCQVVGTCPPTCTVNDPEPCAGAEYTDATNGGCNSTPNVFGNAVAGVSQCGTVSTYVAAGADRRDTDWHLYTVGASGTVRVDFSAQPPTVSFLITSGSTCPASGITGLGHSQNNSCASYQVNGLTPGSQVVVFFGTGNPDGSAIFTGFPCGNPQGNNYTFRVTSP